jgi:hypothetical protein
MAPKPRTKVGSILFFNSMYLEAGQKGRKCQTGD